MWYLNKKYKQKIAEVVYEVLRRLKIFSLSPVWFILTKELLWLQFNSLSYFSVTFYDPKHIHVWFITIDKILV